MKRLIFALALAGALPAGVALAQQSPSGAGLEPSPAPEATPSSEAAPVTIPQKARTNGGPSARFEAGMMNFPGGAHDFLNPGFTFGAALGVDAAQAVGLELSYQGATYGTKGGLEGPRESIVENGGQALLKVGPKTKSVDVYALGGYGLSFINVAERPDAERVVQDDWVSKVPVGLGIDLKVPAANNAALVVGARSTYNFLFSNTAYQGESYETQPITTTAGRSGDQINTQLTLGGKF